MDTLGKIVYLSQAQYDTLLSEGSITVDGVTVTYSDNDIYMTPQSGVEIADIPTGGESSVEYTFSTPRDWFIMCAINIGSGSPSSAAQKAYFGATQVKQDGTTTNWMQTVSGAVDYLNKSHLVVLITLGEIGSAVADTTAVSFLSSTNLKVNPFDNSKKGKVTKVSYTLQKSGGSRTSFADGSHVFVIAGNY